MMATVEQSSVPQTTAEGYAVDLLGQLIAGFNALGSPDHWPDWNFTPFEIGWWEQHIYDLWSNLDAARPDNAGLLEPLMSCIRIMRRDWLDAGKPADFFKQAAVHPVARYAYSVAGDPKTWGEPFDSLPPEQQGLLVRGYASWTRMHERVKAAAPLPTSPEIAPAGQSPSA